MARMRGSDGAGRHGGPRGRGHRLVPGLRIAAVVALLAALALGERSAAGLSLDSTPFVHTLPTGAVAVMLGLGTLLILLALLFGVRRPVAGRGAGPRKRSNPLVTAIVWALALTAAALVPRSQALMDLRHRLTPEPIQAPQGAAPRLPAPHTEPILPLLAVAGALALAALLLHLLRARSRPHPPAAGTDVSDETSQTLADAGAAGLRQIAAAPGDSDHRAAVLAAYAAMEDVLARTGVRRGRAETPDELLDRVRGQGLAGAAAAQRLVAVFGRARWSSEPVGAQDRAQAAQALADLAALHPLTTGARS